MTIKQVYELFGISDMIYLPEAVNKIITGDIIERNEFYKELIRINNNDLSKDWFSEIYESELAQRKQNKQDFTPNSVSKLASLLTGNPKGWIHEPTAGNGGMIIVDWWIRCKNVLPWEYFPSENMISCWELSDRALPILLLNLSIRGIMGYVYHGDVLTQEVKAKYILLNRKDDPLAFSEIIKDVNNEKQIYQKS